METWILWTAIRLIIPLTILRWPLPGVLLSAYADMLDYNRLPLQTQLDYERYQIWDKLLDIYYLSYAVYIASSWKNVFVRRIALATYAYRAIGVFVLILTRERYVLFIFPNFFEIIFIVYLLQTKLGRDTWSLLSSKKVIAAIVIIPAIKLVQEYYLHILHFTLARSLIDTIQWLITLLGLIAILIWHVGKPRFTRSSI